MRTPKDIEALARRIAFEPDALTDERILSAAETALDSRTNATRVDQTCLMRRLIMKKPIAKLAVAAAVLGKVNSFDTCVFRSREVETTGPRPDGFEFATEKESKTYRSTTYGCFIENYENGKLAVRHYTLLQEKQHVSLFEGGTPKLCLRGPFIAKSVREFEQSDPRRIVTRILAGAYVELGNDVIEGKPVRGVELRDPNFLVEEGQKGPLLDDFSARFWIDAGTQLPVWVEISYLPQGSPVRMTQIWDRFEWGVPLEASLFQPEISADYEIVDNDRNYKAPDTTPKNVGEEAFAKQTLAEPYLGDFDSLPLPDVSKLSLLGTDPTAPRPQVRLLGGTEIRMAHDACVAKWPPYEQVQAQLRQELQAKLQIDTLDVTGLVTAGIALRNLFWELGGCLSDTAYPYVYAARLLDEIAHEKAPDNPAVSDQLLESIGAYEVLYYWDDPAPAEPRRNPIYAGVVADLCYEQWALLKARISRGDTPTWKDFVRCSDIATASRVRKDQATNLEVIRMLIEQAPKAGWTTYLDDLKRGEQTLLAGEVYKGPGTFMGGIGDINLEQYSRRLRSFQGPPEYRAQRTPVHLRHLKGW
jgi:hypothetical protein